MPKRDFSKEQSWIKKFEDYEKSGLSIAQWCERNNEKTHTFKYWRQRLQITNTQSIEFEEIADSVSPYMIKICRKELCICLPNDINEKNLKACLLAMGKTPC